MSARRFTSKATTAYQLLQEVKAVARQHPRRICYDDYASCIGGWAERLTGSNNADAVLGLVGKQKFELFGDSALVAEAYDIGRTRVHAKHVIAHVAAFQKKYKAQLKAKAVSR